MPRGVLTSTAIPSAPASECLKASHGPGRLTLPGLRRALWHVAQAADLWLL